MIMKNSFLQPGPFLYLPELLNVPVSESNTDTEISVYKLEAKKNRLGKICCACALKGKVVRKVSGRLCTGLFDTGMWNMY
jgi:hypothetical protein